MIWTRMLLCGQIVLASAALALYGAVQSGMPVTSGDSTFIAAPGNPTLMGALLLATGAGGLAASFSRRAWVRRVACAALFVPVLLQAAGVAGGGADMAGFAYAGPDVLTMLMLFTWVFRLAGLAALLGAAAAVVLVVIDVRGVRRRSYPQGGDPGARGAPARD
ncbi:MAG TPA: hypothetical protein VGL93_06200 [Streptosporangiaceae bacterium]|jgi:hypothetical protein